MREFAAIFDWDGVVIDSSAQHEKSWELLSGETGKPLPAGHFKKGFGKKNQVIISDILGWSHDPEEIQRLGRPEGGSCIANSWARRNDNPAGRKRTARRVQRLPEFLERSAPPRRARISTPFLLQPDWVSSSMQSLARTMLSTASPRPMSF